MRKGVSLQLLLLRQKIEQTALWRRVGAGLVGVGDTCAGGPLSGQQVADAFEDTTGLVTDIHAELFGDADAGLEEDAANGEFLEIALRRTDGSLHDDKSGQGSISCIGRRVGRHQARRLREVPAE